MNTSEKTFDEFEELVLELDMARIIFAEEEEEEEEARIVVSIKDITERKLAEAALRKSEQRFKNLYQDSPIPTFTWQKKGDNFILVDFNSAAIQITNGKVRDHLGNSAVELYRNRPHVLSDMNLCFQERSVVRREITSQNFAPGRLLSVHYGFISPDLIIVHTEDQTDRKQAEEALRQSEENFRRSLDDSPLGMRIVTIEGETIYANRAILDIYGYDSVEELRTTLIKNRYTPQSYAEFRIRSEKRRQGVDGPSEYEVSIVRKNGEIRHLQVLRKDVLWNGERQFQVVYQDITERKRAEEMIKVSEEKYRIIFDEAPMGIAISTIEGKIIELNKAQAEMIGGTVEELKGRSVNEYYVYADKRREMIELFKKTGKVRDFEMGLKKKDGSIIVELLNLDQVKIGGKDYLFATGRDITERKRMEEEKHHLEERSRKVVEDIFRFIPEGVLVFSRKMELLRQNQAFRELVSGYAQRLGFAEDELENLIVDKIKAAMGDKNIKEIRISRKYETGEQT